MSSPAGILLHHLRQLAPQPAPDAELLGRWRSQHDEAAFANLVERHGPMVLGVCRRVLGEVQLAEDAFQATFLVLAREAGKVRRPEALPGFLHGVAVRLARKARAARRRWPAQPPADAPEPADPRPDPLDVLTGRELLAVLDEEVARLPERFRLPVVLCLLEARPVEEAARVLGWTPGSVRGRLARGRVRLRERLARRGLGGCAGALVLLAPVPVSGRLLADSVRNLTGPSPGLVRALAAAAGPSVRLRMVCVGILLTLVGLGAGLAVLPAPQPQGRTGSDPAVSSPARQETRRDLHGDPLPEGTLLRFGSARLRHGGCIRASLLSPDGKSLATAGDHSVIVWDLGTGTALRRFPCDEGNGYTRPALAFSPDGTRLAYVRSGYFACAWDLRTGRELRRFPRRFEDGVLKHWTTICQFGRDGNELVLASHEAVQTWDLASGALTSSVAAERPSLLAADGKTYYRLEDKTGFFQVELATGKTREHWNLAVLHDGVEDGLALSPDGKTLALVDAHREIQLRATEGGNLLASFPFPASARRDVGGRTYWEYRLGFAADGKTLLLGTYGGTTHRWDLATKRELPTLGKHGSAVAGMQVLPGGDTLTAGQDGVIRRWESATGREVSEPERYEGRGTAVYSPDGRFVAIGDARGRLDLWDARGGKRLQTLQQQGEAVARLAFAPDSKLLAAAESSGTVRLWQVPSGQPGEVWRRELDREVWYCNGIHFSPDGRFLCVNEYPRRIRVLEVASGKLHWSGPNSYGEAFTPDGKTLLVTRSGPNVALLDADTGKEVSKARLSLEIPDRLGEIYTLAYSPDGRRLAVAVATGRLALFNGRTFALEHRLAAGQSPTHMDMNVIRGVKPLNDIQALAFSSDGKWLASAGSDTAITVWEAATGKEVLRLPGHEATVTSLAFRPDGHSLFSYGEDGQGYLWNLRPGPAAEASRTLEEQWADLAGTDAGRAYRAAWALAEDPRGVSLLARKLTPAVQPDRNRLARLIADLDAQEFEIRQGASRALSEFAELAVPALEEARKTASSAEQRRRLEELLAAVNEGSSPVQLAQSRAVQALELARSPEARRALEGLAQGAPNALLTREAQAALVRLKESPR